MKVAEMTNHAQHNLISSIRRTYLRKIAFENARKAVAVATLLLMVVNSGWAQEIDSTVLQDETAAAGRNAHGGTVTSSQAVPTQTSTPPRAAPPQPSAAIGPASASTGKLSFYASCRNQAAAGTLTATAGQDGSRHLFADHLSGNGGQPDADSAGRIHSGCGCEGYQERLAVTAIFHHLRKPDFFQWLYRSD